MNDKVSTWSWKQIIVLIIGILCLAIIGCREMMDEVTPAIVDGRSRTYLNEDPNSPRKIITLAKAKEMRKDIGIKHRDYLLDLRRDIEDDENAYQDALLIDARIEQSERWQNLVIGDASNPMSVMGILAGSSLAGLVGYHIKRKGDSSPDEVKVEVAKAKAVEEQKNGSGAAKKV